ncbi:polysaccharide pyruvyl transferase family protein [Carnobacterium funditum]|uniref:polysaccharide pyruvyl transferase family protein n=1 Tax=Carnobacterium funditum TaxID=2752 RepID=UPI000558DD64|nr:polysaccharide pyruvyl transferase family protein [Carnobacterium funditum]
MKKIIGVVTFHRSLNYGAVLQTYGLVKAIESEGYEVNVVDYRNDQLENRDSYKRFFKTKGLFRIIYQYLDLPFWIIRRNKFDAFLSNIVSGKRYTEIGSEADRDYDSFMVGSDQVWNYKITNSDENFFLNKITNNIKKNSYAASFGISKIPKDKNEYYQKGLNNFNCISVREDTGAIIVEKYKQYKPEVVLDPSLLLNKEEWISVSDKSKLKYDYILIYQRAYSKTLIDFAKRISEENECKIITINGNPRQKVNGKNIIDAGPEEWLSLMNNAKYIVTNSFHGVAFSINLNKEFFVELLDEKFGVNSRLDNIIKLFNLEDRLIKNNLKKNLDKIDYLKVNEILEKNRIQSKKYIRNTLRGL